MQHRHFLVREEGDAYQLREIDAAVAKGINQFGNVMGQHQTIESGQCTFYFINVHIPEKKAYHIAQELTQEILSGNR